MKYILLLKINLRLFKMFSSGLHSLHLLQLFRFVCFCFSLFHIRMPSSNIWSFKSKTSKADWKFQEHGKELQVVGFPAVWHWRRVIFSQYAFFIGLVSFPRKEPFTFLSSREWSKAPTLCKRRENWGLTVQ